jgi:hypothetical protein
MVCLFRCVTDTNSKVDAMDRDNSYVTVALGNTWSHCVNTRLIVQYVDGVTRQVLALIMQNARILVIRIEVNYCCIPSDIES